MRAAYFQGHGDLSQVVVGEIPAPEPREKEIRVRVKAAALNHLDLWVLGGLPSLKLSFPHVPAGDVSGIVDKVGSQVTQHRVGDEVILHPGLSCMQCESCLSGWETFCPEYQILGEHRAGGLAEFVCVPQANVFAKPNSVSFEEAAAFPLAFVTAWQMAVKRGAIRDKEKVVVHAAGSGVSVAAIQIAKLFDAEILATAGSDEKLRKAEELGATHTVNYHTGDFLATVKKVWPKGADLILDHVGKDVWEKNIKSLRPNGRLVTCGATSGFDSVLDLRHLFFRQLQLMGSTMGSKLDFPELLGHFGQGKLRAIVDRVFPLDQSQEAFKRLQSREGFGKVVVSP